MQPAVQQLVTFNLLNKKTLRKFMDLHVCKFSCKAVFQTHTEIVMAQSKPMVAVFNTKLNFHFWQPSVVILVGSSKSVPRLDDLVYKGDQVIHDSSNYPSVQWCEA